jgi:hypothetical protein
MIVFLPSIVVESPPVRGLDLIYAAGLRSGWGADIAASIA